MTRVLLYVGLTMCATVFLAAQAPAPPPQGPPGCCGGIRRRARPSPSHPTPADRVTLTGCVARAEGAPATFDANTPSDNRYLLTGAKREKRVPAGTGTSPAAAAVTGDRFRLVGHRSVDFAVRRHPRRGVRPGRDSVRRGRQGTPKLPVLRVEFVKKLAPSCS